MKENVEHVEEKRSRQRWTLRESREQRRGGREFCERSRGSAPP